MKTYLLCAAVAATLGAVAPVPPAPPVVSAPLAQPMTKSAVVLTGPATALAERLVPAFTNIPNTAIIWGTDIRQATDAHIAAMRYDESLTNVLRKLVGEGEVCRIRGHAWRDGRPGAELSASEWLVNTIDAPNGREFRTCRLCGRCESKGEPEWKEYTK